MAARQKRTEPDPRKVVGYVRVSKDEQALGPEAQKAAIRAWCEAHGAGLVAVFEDLGVRGATPLEKRVGLNQALDALTTQGAGVLLVARRDRLARDVIVGAMFERLVERQGARVFAADGTGNGDGPEAELMRRIVDAFAAYERMVIAARTRAALRVKKARGERVGAVPPEVLILADAAEMGEPPGTLSLLPSTAIAETGASTHDFALSLIVTFLTAQHPMEVVVLAMQPGSRDLGAAPTPALTSALRAAEALFG